MVNGDRQDKIKHNLATHLVQIQYYNIDFGDPKAKVHDSKMGRAKPVEKQCTRVLFVPVLFTIVNTQNSRQSGI